MLFIIKWMVCLTTFAYVVGVFAIMAFLIIGGLVKGDVDWIQKDVRISATYKVFGPEFLALSYAIAMLVNALLWPALLASFILDAFED